jgi:hypothetical protein
MRRSGAAAVELVVEESSLRTCASSSTQSPPAGAARVPGVRQRDETVAHSVCASIQGLQARILIEHRLDETAACPIDDTIVSAPPPPAIVERGKHPDLAHHQGTIISNTSALISTAASGTVSN